MGEEEYTMMNWRKRYFWSTLLDFIYEKQANDIKKLLDKHGKK
jgi:hypothetical protein